ncbi:ATP-binding cassette domain-containing protein [Streptomyces erythrochromogenes]|uniref:ATP-binding cassette domain-containing protein n=1 Tax=Streptomyces erythrochromogenes TaxID=285574 RepID=UPI00224F4A6F|nr:ABC transporter ATP-binding protein [Streptomyces erythrochromogenes]MCX5582233.1 ABC transporter ATP-binding protein/permease [Streptomyces erythrochromogenes]
MRLLKRPTALQPAVSASERRLFGGPLRYDAGWSNHDYARLEGRLLSTLRSMPRMVAGTLRLAWDTDRPALLTVAAAEAGQGVTSAVGLLVLSEVLRTLLGAGTPAERLHAAMPALAAGALVAVLGAVLASRSTAAAGRLEPKIERAAHEQYLKAAVEVELEAIEDGEFRRLLDSAQWGPPSARRTVGACVATLGGIISLVATAGVLTVLHPLLLPMLLLIAAPRGWGAMRVAQRRYLSVITWVEHVRAARLIGQLLISRTSAPEVRVHGVGRYLLGHYRNMAEVAETEATRLAKDKAATELLAAALSGAAALVTYGAMVALIVTGRMDLAVAGTAVIAVRTGSASLGALVATTNTLHEESLYVRDLERFVAEAGRRAIPDGGLPLPERLGTVRLEDVRFSYPDRDEPALDGISLTIEAGTVVALVGENGSGKSTLVKLLAGLHLPDSGSLTWDGVEVRNADREQVFDRVALLTQDFERWPVTARTNIAIGRPGAEGSEEAVERAAEVVAAARYAGADRVVEKLPNGYETLLARVFRGASELSGGQWQKFGLARTRFRDARVIVVDEPTSALDPEAEIAAFDSIRGLTGPQRAVVLVTHRMSGVRYADVIYVLHEGRLVEQGGHEELLELGGRYASMFRMQAEQFAQQTPSPTPTPTPSPSQASSQTPSPSPSPSRPRSGSGSSPIPRQTGASPNDTSVT